MSDTPETDAAQHEGLLRTNPIPMQVVTANFARRLERERDEARDKLADWEDSAKHVRSEWPDEQHCSCVPILRKLLKDAERERDKYWASIIQIDEITKNAGMKEDAK